MPAMKPSGPLRNLFKLDPQPAQPGREASPADKVIANPNLNDEQRTRVALAGL